MAGRTQVPIVFLHGNYDDRSAWEEAAQYLRQRGYDREEVWRIEFDQASPTHPEMAAQIEEYVEEVRRETGSDEVDLVGHSLGATGGRWWLRTHHGHERTRAYVSVAGANHGLTTATWACRLGMAIGPWSPSAFLRADYHLIDDHPLKWLNRNETPGTTRYYTIRGLRDSLFSLDPESPRLCGATQNVAIEESHSGLRTSEVTHALLEDWLRQK